MSKTMKRPTRPGIRILLPLISVLGASACGPAAETPAPASTASGGQAAPSGEVSFQVFGDPAELAVFEAVVDGYKKVNPSVKVNINHVPAQGDHMTKLSSAFAAGNPPDVFLLNYRRYGQFADKNVLEPLGNWLAKSTTIKADDYFPQALSAFTFNGTIQCIPQNISSLGVYYNKDLFEKNNLPMPTADWTWSDFVSTAQALTRDNDGDGIMDVHGLGVEPLIIRMAPFVWAHGGTIVDNTEKPSKLTLDTPESREAVQFFMNLSLAHRVVPTEPEIKAEALESRFMNGKLGMFLGSRADTPIFRTIKDFTWDVAAMPRDKEQATILHSDAYCMPASSTNKEAAWDFIQYAQGDEGQTIAAQLGRTVPSRKSVANSTAFLDPTQLPANSQMYLDAIPTMKLVPISASWPAVENAVNKELERAFFGSAPLDEALRIATEMANAEFARANSSE